MLSGLVVFESGHRGAGRTGTKVAEGVLSAVSAGMLIYAAYVEMLAATVVRISCWTRHCGVPAREGTAAG